jgi:hypothetical protein
MRQELLADWEREFQTIGKMRRFRTLARSRSTFLSLLFSPAYFINIESKEYFTATRLPIASRKELITPAVLAWSGLGPQNSHTNPCGKS